MPCHGAAGLASPKAEKRDFQLIDRKEKNADDNDG